MDIDSASFYRGDEYDGYESPRLSDREFITEQLQKLPHWTRAKVLAKYSITYEDILKDATIDSGRRLNVARNNCNTRLRAAIEKLTTDNLPPSS